MTRAQRREYDATQRRAQQDRERLQREHARAQRSLEAIEQALIDVGLPEMVAAAVPWRVQTGGKRLGQICGRRCPTVCGCRTHHERSRIRNGDKHRPGPILGALPKQTWLRQLQHRGQDLLAPLGRHVEDKSPATRSRWPWTWVGDDRVFQTAGQPLGLVGTWYSGQEQRVRRGSDGLLRLVVIGAGQRLIPVDGRVRRPDPLGPGRPCRDTLTWLQVRLERTDTALQRLGLARPAPRVVADRWCGDSKRLAHVAHHPCGPGVVAGKSPDVCPLSDGRRLPGQELLTRADGPWRDSLQWPRKRYGRLTATSPTSGPVTGVIVQAPRQACDDLLWPATPRTAPRLMRAWKRRRWMEHDVRTLTHLLATDACQVQGADADDGHLVWRLWAGLVRLYTAHRRLNGRGTMEESVCSLKPHWRFLPSKDLE